MRLTWSLANSLDEGDKRHSPETAQDRESDRPPDTMDGILRAIFKVRIRNRSVYF